MQPTPEGDQPAVQTERSIDPLEQLNQHLQPTEAREATPTDPEDQMKEFDRLKKRESEIGIELDSQLNDVLTRKTEWASMLPWTEMVEKRYPIQMEGEPEYYQDEESVTYRVESTDSSGHPVVLKVYQKSNRAGLFVSEVTAQDEVVGMTLLYGATYPGHSTRQMKRGMVGYIDPKDKQIREYVRNGWGSHFKVEESASTSYGYDDYGGDWRNERQRYLAPGMEHLRSPLEYAKDAMDKLERGKITAKSVSQPGEWKPVTEPIQPPARNI